MYYIYILYVYICNHEKRVDLWQLIRLDLSCVPSDMSSHRAMWRSPGGHIVIKILYFLRPSCFIYIISNINNELKLG